MLISASDTKFSILSSLLLVKIRILSCFLFLLFVMLSNFLIILVAREKIKVKLVLAIPTGALKTFVNKMIDIPPVVALKTIKILSM